MLILRDVWAPASPTSLNWELCRRSNSELCRRNNWVKMMGQANIDVLSWWRWGRIVSCNAWGGILFGGHREGTSYIIRQVAKQFCTLGRSNTWDSDYSQAAVSDTEARIAVEATATFVPLLSGGLSLDAAICSDVYISFFR